MYFLSSTPDKPLAHNDDPKMENKALIKAEVEKHFPLPIHATFDPTVDYYLYSRIQGLGNEHMVPLAYYQLAGRSDVLEGSLLYSCRFEYGSNFSC